MTCSIAVLVLAVVTGSSRALSSQENTITAITGRVIGATAGAESAVRFWLQPENEWRTVTCGPDGSFTIDRICAARGPILLHAVRRQTVVDGNIHADCDPEWERASPELSVAPGTRGVELSVPQSSHYRLRVVEAGTGQPLTGVRFGLLGAFDFEAGAVPNDVRAEGDGTYSIAFHRPDAGDGRALAVACEEHERVAVGELPFAPGETQHLETVELIRLAPTQLLVVSDLDGRPVEGAAVTASIESNDDGCLNAHMVGEWPARRALPDGWSGSTSADGTVTAFLSSGTSYWIAVKHPGHALLWHRAVTHPRAPERLELRLPLPATISVRCVDERTREPVAGEELGYERIDTYENERARTGPDGTVCIEDLIPGTYRFWSVRHGRGYHTVIAVGAGATAEVTLPIRPLDPGR